MSKIQAHQLYQPRTLQQPTPPIKKQVGSDSFQSLLTDQLKTPELKISKHANQRMLERQISINTKQWQEISQKVKEAKDKGITDSVVVTQNAALVVNTTNQTVITAMDRKEASTHLFSNINGAILLD